MLFLTTAPAASAALVPVAVAGPVVAAGTVAVDIVAVGRAAGTVVVAGSTAVAVAAGHPEPSFSFQRTPPTRPRV